MTEAVWIALIGAVVSIAGILAALVVPLRNLHRKADGIKETVNGNLEKVKVDLLIAKDQISELLRINTHIRNDLAVANRQITELLTSSYGGRDES